MTNARIARFVEAAARTTTSVASDANPQTAGAKVTLTAYAVPVIGIVIAAGTVGFSVDKAAPVEVPWDDTH